EKEDKKRKVQSMFTDLKIAFDTTKKDKNVKNDEKVNKKRRNGKDIDRENEKSTGSSQDESRR
ncbi:unnamed protein product, partial [Heterotrigona itama]